MGQAFSDGGSSNFDRHTEVAKHSRSVNNNTDASKAYFHVIERWLKVFHVVHKSLCFTRPVVIGVGVV